MEKWVLAKNAKGVMAQMVLEDHLKIYEELGYKVRTGITFGNKKEYHLILNKGKNEYVYIVKKRDYRKIYKFMTTRKDEK